MGSKGKVALGVLRGWATLLLRKCLCDDLEALMTDLSEKATHQGV